MNEYRKIIVFLFASVLLLYMIKLAIFTKKKWEFKTSTFFVLIGGLSLLTIGTFLDMLSWIFDYGIIKIAIDICFTLGTIIYIIGVIFWSNYTKEIIGKLQEIVLTDSLTGVLNRNGIEKVFARVTNTKDPFYVIVCDLDGTKRINDKFGHLDGDKYIKNTAKIMTSMVGLKGYVGRIGGDEFIILLGYLNIEELQQIKFNIKQKVEEIFPEQKTGISIGYSLYPSEGEEFGELMGIADSRMYEEKKTEKDK